MATPTDPKAQKQKPVEAAPAPAKLASQLVGDGKTSRGDEIRVADDFSTEGFVTADSIADARDTDDWAKLHLDRHMYKADFCARFGGVQGYLIEIDNNMKSKEAVREDNPEGFFTAAIIRLTKPCPVVNDKGVVSKAEAGTDVIVVLNHTIKKLAELDQPGDHAFELMLLPKTKERLKNNHDLWRFEANLKLSPVKKSSINAAAAAFKKWAQDQKQLTEGAPKSATPAAQPAAASV